MDSNNRVLGPKDYSTNGIWALKPYYLCPWTLLKKPKLLHSSIEIIHRQISWYTAWFGDSTGKQRTMRASKASSILREAPTCTLSMRNKNP